MTSVAGEGSICYDGFFFFYFILVFRGNSISRGEICRAKYFNSNLPQAFEERSLKVPSHVGYFRVIKNQTILNNCNKYEDLKDAGGRPSKYC